MHEQIFINIYRLISARPKFLVRLLRWLFREKPVLGEEWPCTISSSGEIGRNSISVYLTSFKALLGTFRERAIEKPFQPPY